MTEATTTVEQAPPKAPDLRQQSITQALEMLNAAHKAVELPRGGQTERSYLEAIYMLLAAQTSLLVAWVADQPRG